MAAVPKPTSTALSESIYGLWLRQQSHHGWNLHTCQSLYRYQMLHQQESLWPRHSLKSSHHYYSMPAVQNRKSCLQNSVLSTCPSTFPNMEDDDRAWSPGLLNLWQRLYFMLKSSTGLMIITWCRCFTAIASLVWESLLKQEEGGPHDYAQKYSFLPCMWHLSSRFWTTTKQQACSGLHQNPMD